MNINKLFNIFTSSKTRLPRFVDEQVEILEPTLLEYIDPQYVEECFIDLEYDKKITKNEKEGVLYIDIYHQYMVHRNQQIDDLLLCNQKRIDILQNIDCAIEKIKLQYPNFIYNISHDIALFDILPLYLRREALILPETLHGTRIFRTLS